MDLAEFDRICNKRIKDDLPGAKMQMIRVAHENGTRGYLLGLNYAGQLVVLSNEEDLDRFLARIGRIR